MFLSLIKSSKGKIAKEIIELLLENGFKEEAIDAELGYVKILDHKFHRDFNKITVTPNYIIYSGTDSGMRFKTKLMPVDISSGSAFLKKANRSLVELNKHNSINITNK